MNKMSIIFMEFPFSEQQPEYKHEKQKEDMKSSLRTRHKLEEMAIDSMEKSYSCLKRKENQMAIYHLTRAMDFLKSYSYLCDDNSGNSPWDPR